MAGVAAAGQVQVIHHGMSRDLFKAPAEVIFAEACRRADIIDGHVLHEIFLNVADGVLYHEDASALRGGDRIRKNLIVSAHMDCHAGQICPDGGLVAGLLIQHFPNHSVKKILHAGVGNLQHQRKVRHGNFLTVEKIPVNDEAIVTAKFCQCPDAVDVPAVDPCHIPRGALRPLGIGCDFRLPFRKIKQLNAVLPVRDELRFRSQPVKVKNDRKGGIGKQHVFIKRILWLHGDSSFGAFYFYKFYKRVSYLTSVQAYNAHKWQDCVNQEQFHFFTFSALIIKWKQQDVNGHCVIT